MPRKKVDSKEVKAEDVTELSFYGCQELINEIQIEAAKNEGELSDEQITVLIEAQTQVPAKLQSLCNFLKLLEAKDKTCKDRIKEIKESQARAKKVSDRMCDFLALWVEQQGKSYHVGEYTLSTRKSTKTIVADGFDDPMFCTIETKTIITPDKKAIKEALLAEEEVSGCELETKLNLTIK